MEKQFCFDYEHYAALAELPEADRRLVAEAGRATANAHAPYSKFHVGAAARLRASAPSGRCCFTLRPTTPTIRSRRWPSLRTPRSASAIPAASAGR